MWHNFKVTDLFQTLPSHSESVKSEINRFERNFIDVAVLQKQAQDAGVLREKVHLLEKRVQVSKAKSKVR